MAGLNLGQALKRASTGFSQGLNLRSLSQTMDDLDKEKLLGKNSAGVADLNNLLDRILALGPGRTKKGGA